MAQIGLLEDNARIANLCATILQYAGHQVTIYGHPRECLKALCLEGANGENRPPIAQPMSSSSLPVEVLILDLNLPDMNGMEVLQSLCSHAHTRSLPLIFCTAAPPSEIVKALRIAPQAGLVEKPFTFQELITAITQALKLLEQQRQERISNEVP